MDSTYSTIKRLEKISDDEYYFGFSRPIQGSIYTIYHEGKISSKSVKQLLSGTYQLGTNGLIDKKMKIVVPNNSFCLVQFEFDGFLVELSSQALLSELRLQSINQKCNDIYSVTLKSADDSLFNFIISETTYYALIEVLDLPVDTVIMKFPDAEFIIFEPNLNEGELGMKLACSIIVSLKDISLKAYFTKTE